MRWEQGKLQSVITSDSEAGILCQSDLASHLGYKSL